MVQKSLREDDRSGGGVRGEVEDKKACTDCKTTKTPLWRGGPAGPKVCFVVLVHYNLVIFPVLFFLLMDFFSSGSVVFTNGFLVFEAV